MQQIIYTNDICTQLASLCLGSETDRVFILTDETTERLCFPLLSDCEPLKKAKHIVIGSTDTNKNVESLVKIWKELSDGKATRQSLLINLGGGMVTDIGGFAAATFKRGIRFFNVPTTLLAMVDAAVGGKTGINFNGLKNEIGAFQEASAVVISTAFLRSLDSPNLYSGFGEMLKHSLLENRKIWADHLRFNLAHPDFTHLQQLVEQSIQCKSHIVEEDPHESGIRKALNLGHTIGHAFESLSLLQARPILHGYAVAWGLVCEIYLSVIHAGFPVDEMRQTVAFIRQNYGTFAFSCKDYEQLYSLMQHDKKNANGQINFTLLGGIGDIRINQHLTQEQVFESFDFLRESF